MRNVTLVRQAVIRVQEHALLRLRGLVSGMEDGGPLADKLRTGSDVGTLLAGRQGETILARLVEVILEELGHATPITVDDTDAADPRSQALKAVRKGRV